MISFSCSQTNTRKQQEDHGERNKAIRSVVETLPNIDQLKPEQEQALLSFVGGQDVVALLPTGFGKPGGALTHRPAKLLTTALFPHAGAPQKALF